MRSRTENEQIRSDCSVLRYRTAEKIRKKSRTESPVANRYNDRFTGRSMFLRRYQNSE